MRSVAISEAKTHLSALLQEVQRGEKALRFMAGDEWDSSRREFFQIENLHLTEPVIFRSGRLPEADDGPFDRLLVAHANESGSTILSPDTPPSQLGASRIC